MSEYYLSARNGFEKDVVCAALRIKGIRFSIEPSDSNDIEFFDHKNCIRGFKTVLEYLDERFLDPNLLPRDPYERAIFRMMCDTLHKAGLENDLTILPDYIPYYRASIFCLSNEQASLLDAFIYALAPDTEPWQSMKCGMKHRYPIR